ncbi:Gmad2 immunoglobulin-like domain-containing protein [Bellilinea sp.]|uniref:Bacterial spore germination immunoglobulin-like domain-containing protein n=1 Tax=Bellilinea caldifistulae TaxID=360411 RepID=A0A7C4Q4U3_9CHLR|nr:Gmad2 immunoglobulin-like domain-containing protein [Bellilinea sp.]
MWQRLLVLLLLLGITAACNLPLSLAVTPTGEETLAASSSPLPQATSTPVLLSSSVLENMLYTLPGFVDREPFSFQLKDGEFQSGEDPAAIDFINVRLGDVIAFGDLNGDDLPDAAVILAANYGGTGVFVWVVPVLNQNGKAEQAAAFLIDDRPMIEQLSIENSRILLEGLVHGPNDPGCCPNQPVRWALRLMPAGLNLVSASTRIGDLWREINLELPVEDSRVGERVEVRGGVPVMPFEATLNYRVYSENGVEYQNSYIMVDAPDYGYPGTFQKEIDLSEVPPGVIYLEVSEISMADGSVVALTSVRLIRE